MRGAFVAFVLLAPLAAADDAPGAWPAAALRGQTEVIESAPVLLDTYLRYAQGETVDIRYMLRTSAPTTAEVRDPTGALVWSSGMPRRDTIAEAQWTIPRDATTGTYEIAVHDGERVQTRRIDIIDAPALLVHELPYLRLSSVDVGQTYIFDLAGADGGPLNVSVHQGDLVWTASWTLERDAVRVWKLVPIASTAPRGANGSAIMLTPSIEITPFVTFAATVTVPNATLTIDASATRAGAPVNASLMVRMAPGPSAWLEIVGPRGPLLGNSVMPDQATILHLAGSPGAIHVGILDANGTEARGVDATTPSGYLEVPLDLRGLPYGAYTIAAGSDRIPLLVHGQLEFRDGPIPAAAWVIGGIVVAAILTLRKR